MYIMRFGAVDLLLDGAAPVLDTTAAAAPGKWRSRKYAAAWP